MIDQVTELVGYNVLAGYLNADTPPDMLQGISIATSDNNITRYINGNLLLASALLQTQCSITYQNNECKYTFFITKVVDVEWEITKNV